ncbi:ABC-F family ATP-binding cassette domain-containing protein [Fundidesulfovibrio soli]|uniref:ABC-F family ATP-binding cassette domain-containing protein n=1 Tax=Fundidesulfovibrio soli TaxID=2922716 RepID=UPI001FAF68BC|nr:ABC-F family ATP-binding cassette domain-containing protein [Fundidesulfovibrio soli]
MSTLISIRDIAKAYGARTLFSNITLTLHQGERVGLIGANGSGKSTLLRILAGFEKPDSGERIPRRQVRLAHLAQKDEFPLDATVSEVVAAPLAGEGLAEAELHVRVGAALSRTGFTDHAQSAGSLSGGWCKRLALARALAQEPDLLLLDEPTNHLDLESVVWLEKMLRGARFAYVVISHDRCFLENTTTRTIELARSYPEGFLSVDGPYSTFLEKRADFLAAQAGLEETLANKVRREVEWLRRGPKARTTKAKARIDEAGRLMGELAETRERNIQVGRAGIEFGGTSRQTRRLMVAEGVSKSLGGRELFSGLDIVLSPGVRLGLVGANGSGKSTLLRILAGEDAPDQGEVRRAPALEVAYFDQNRARLDQQLSLKATLAPHGDAVVYRGRSVHVVSWAKRFLFRPDQLDLPVSLLSGGEQARLLIAQLMLRPADVLLLDEPTNDLDIPTLEILEESLRDFPGAVVLISHDRYLLDTVSTGLLGLDGRGGAVPLADLEQWERVREEAERAETPGQAPAQAKARPAKQPAKKLTYKEQKEFDGMEQAIAQAEEALAAREAELADPAVAHDPTELQLRMARQEEARAEVDRLYARWAELEDKLAD